MNPSDNDKTRMIDIGGGNIGILFPDVYFRFVSELYKKHPDLIKGMELSQVRLQDGSALDWLNFMLGTDVKREDPMEIGYAKLLDALHQRISNVISDSKIRDLVAQHKDFLHEQEGKLEPDQLFPELPNQ